MNTERWNDIWKIIDSGRLQFDQSNTEILCIICKKVLINAHSGPCGCRYCLKCITQYLNEEERICPGTTDYCQDELISINRNIFPDQPMNQRILDTTVKCPHQNCEFTDKLRKIEDHIRICDIQSVKCPYLDVGCKENNLANTSMKNHMLLEIVSHSKLLFEFLDNLKNEIKIINENNMRLEDSNQDLQTCVDDLQIKHDNEYKDLKEILKETENKFQEEKENGFALKKEVYRLNEELESLKKDFIDIKKCVDDSKLKYESENREIKENLTEIKNNLIEERKCMSDLKLKFENENREIKETLTKIQNNSVEEQKNVYELKQEIKLINDENALMKKDLLENKKYINETKLKYEVENREIKEKVMMIKNNLVEEQKNVGQVKKEIKVVNDEKEILKKNLSENKKCITDSKLKYEDENRKIKENLTTIKNNLCEEKKNIEDLKKEVKIMNDEREIMKKDLSEIKRREMTNSGVNGESRTINILLLGETEVGKSTWVNGFVNYLTYDSLEEAERGAPVSVIPARFTVSDSNFKEHKIVYDIDNDSNESTERCGQSATQMPKSYLFITRNAKIRIIDTPGMGDARGIERDRENMENTLNHLSQYEEIDGIVILLKPNNARLNVMFEYCIKELLSHLHKDASENILFCFTNTRSTFYRPGDTLPALKNILSRNRSIDIKLHRDSVYCVDNEAVRFLMARRTIEFDESDRQDFATSWKRTVNESKRMVSFISSLEPHAIQKSLLINKVRRSIVNLGGQIGKNIDIDRQRLTKIKTHFGYFLKHNSIIPFNDALLVYLYYLIRNERMINEVGASPRTLEGLVHLRHTLVQDIKSIEDAMNVNSSSVSICENRIKELIVELSNSGLMRAVKVKGNKSLKMKETVINLPQIDKWDSNE